MSEMLLARYKYFFLHRIVTGDEKWIHYDNPNRRKSWGLTRPRVNIHIHSKTEYLWKKLMLCICWDQLGVVYYVLLNPSETITGTLYRTELMRLSRTLKENCLNTTPDIRQNYFLRDNARPRSGSGENYMKTLDWEVLSHPPFTRHCAVRLIICSGYFLSELRFTS
ncbi:Mariner Mos1 transposase [Eumeta japonica]|uniref:Mariner Mos1 transposase n=1 Tax=Eumeta variegata TaxID=151549 RepID=A0A4C1Z0J2_EUMVA|nr:Mariner Mos1 transposase [Eumeta japonica]